MGEGPWRLYIHTWSRGRENGWRGLGRHLRSPPSPITPPEGAGPLSAWAPPPQGRFPPMLRGGCGGPSVGPGGVQGRKGALAGPRQCHGEIPSHLMLFGTPRCRIQPCSTEASPSPGHRPRLWLACQDAALCLLTPPAPHLVPQLLHRCSPKASCLAWMGTPEHPFKQRAEPEKGFVSERLVCSSCWVQATPVPALVGGPLAPQMLVAPLMLAGNSSAFTATHATACKWDSGWSPALLSNQLDGIPAIISDLEDFILNRDSVSHRR